MARERLETDADVRKRVEKRFEKRKEFIIHAASYGVVVGGMWAGYVLWNTDGGFPWPLTMALGWGAGLAAHFIDMWYQAGAPARRRDQAVWREMRALYGDDWREDASKDEYKDVQKRVGKSFDKTKDFAIHLTIFVMINLMLWILWGASSRDGFPWPLLVSGLWGIGLVSHAADSWLNRGQEAAIEREVERERERMAQEMAMKQKRKREHAAELRLSADGELLEVIDEPDAERKQMRR